MPRKRISEEQKKAVERQNKIIQDLFALELQWAEDSEEELDPALLNRQEVAPPEPPEISKYNPDGIHDVITFAEHPYFCGLKLHPWQKLVLKLFYMGTEGNQNLSVDQGYQRDTNTCDGCVWKYVKKVEDLAAQTWKEGHSKKGLLPIENTKCLTCTRFDPKNRELRFNDLMVNAKTLHEERKYERIQNETLIDQYTSEADLLSHRDFNQEIRKQVDAKLGNRFEELVLVLGRRSGKGFLVSVIALYETYRLLSMKHPQKRYNLLDFDEITITNVAVNEDQAKKGIFSKIKPIAMSSPYFMDKIGKDTELELRFLTENDAKENKRRSPLGITPLVGSIILKCGHSNAAGLVGATNWCVIIDELAAMVGENVEAGTDYRLYDDLVPSIGTFGADGKILSLSNPKGPHGLLFDLYEERQLDPTTLVLQLPTWVVNPSIPMDWLDTQRAKAPQEFPMQFGAEFGEASTSPFLDKDLIEMAFHGRPQARLENPQPHVQYYCHVDPAESSDYYALAVVHAIPGATPQDQPFVSVDHIHYWEPEGKMKPVAAEEVEKYIIELNKRFRFAQVSFDQWNSQSTVARLTQGGVRAVVKPFVKPYVELIYGTLYQLFAENRIIFYNINTEFKDPTTNKMTSLQEVEMAKQQLKMLQKKWRGKNYKIEALSGYNDDIADCIAAAACECLNSKVSRPFPKTRLVYMGL